MVIRPLAISYIFIAIILSVIVTYFITYFQTSEAASYNPIDPTNEYNDYKKSGVIDSYTVSARLVEINNEQITLKTPERELTIKKPANTRYFIVANNTRQPITEEQFIQVGGNRITLRNEDSVSVLVKVDKSTHEIRSLRVVIQE